MLWLTAFEPERGRTAPQAVRGLVALRTRCLLEPRLAQPLKKMIDVSRIEPSPPIHACGKLQVPVQRLELGQRGLRLFNPSELGQPGDDIAQAVRIIPVERPRASPGFDSLLIVPHLIVRPGQRD